MKPTFPLSGLSRRALLSALAVLPTLSGTLLAASPTGGALPSWNDGPAKQAILDLRACHNRPG